MQFFILGTYLLIIILFVVKQTKKSETIPVDYQSFKVYPKDEVTRKLIDELCLKLGFEKPTYYESINTASLRHSEDFDKWVVKYGELKTTDEKLNLLLKHLKLEVFEGKELRKSKSN